MKPNHVSDLFTCERILPPFLGELGYEVRHFVGLVEPWLRSGWKLISKRPELYPSGTTLCPRDLFDEISALKIRYNGQEMHSGICVEFPRRESIPARDYAVVRRNFEFDLRSLLRPYIDRPGRPLTLFDKPLTSASHGLSEFFFSSYHGLRPSYKPESFACGDPSAPSHIGVQFRRLAGKDEHRNSDWQRHFPRLNQLAHETGLKLLVYGEPSGCEFPPDCSRASTHHPIGSTGLAGDLTCLRSCRLMFSPDSGWTDLMAWLQVPSIVMQLHTDYTYLSAIPFDPVIEVYDEKVPLLEQFTQCVSRTKSHLELLGSNNGSTHLIPSLFELNTVWRN
jgi:hypothetical protein